MAASLKQMIEEQQTAFHELKQLGDALEAGTAPDNASERIDALNNRLDELEVSIPAAQAQLDKIKNRTIAGVNDRKAVGNDGASLADALEYELGNGRKLSIGRDDPRRALCTKDYEQAFSRYLKNEARGEMLNLKVGNETKGGYLVPPAFSSQIIKFVDDAVAIRRLSRVITLPSAVSLGMPSWDTDPSDADWSPEVRATSMTPDTAMAVGKREFTPHAFQKLVKISETLVRVYPQIEPWVAERLGYKFAVTEEKAFMTGDGSSKPLGVFTPSSNGVPTSRDVTCSSQTVFTADEIINLLMSLKSQYQARATFVFSREFLSRARKLKSSDNGYLWTPGLGGLPSTILDRPYIMSEYAPNTFTSGNYIALCGDFSNYYIVESAGMSLQVIDQLYTEYNQVGYKMTRHVDATPVLGEAFARLKLA